MCGKSSGVPFGVMVAVHFSAKHAPDITKIASNAYRSCSKCQKFISFSSLSPVVFMLVVWAQTAQTKQKTKLIFLFCLCCGLCQTAYGVVRCITAEQNLALSLHRTLHFRIFEFRKAAAVCTVDVLQFVSFVAVGHTAKTALPKLQSGHLKNNSVATIAPLYSSNEFFLVGRWANRLYLHSNRFDL